MSSRYNIIFLFFFILLRLSVFSQDTIKVMQYNLLYYGLNTDFCTSSNNNVVEKELQFKKILKYVKPNILAVNEISSATQYADRFLNNVLNTDGINYYAKVQFNNVSNSNLSNMLYYDTRKIKFHSHKTLTSYIRDINMFKLYHNSPDLAVTYDTTFIYCVVAHLKAGNTENDLYARKMMTQYAMSNLNSQNIQDNILFMGDLNTKSSSEDAFQNLINHYNMHIKLYDPINKLGTWNNNAVYKSYHTQSTNVSSNNCISGGGLDDRFDFILINNAVKNNLYKVEYIDGSYKALGQDGLRFNQSIISPANTVVPVDIAQALFKASDHLPVILELLVDRMPAHINSYHERVSFDIKNLTYNNKQLQFELLSSNFEVAHISILNLLGQAVYQKDWALEKGQNTVVLNNLNLSKGIYMLTLSNQKDGIKPHKFLVNN